MLFAVSAFGKPIGLEAAKSIAQKHLEQKHGKKIGKIRQVKTKTHKAKAVPYFVFDKENGGFVIVSANSAAVPILGETESGSFDYNNMPPAMLWLLETYESQIEAVAQMDETQIYSSPPVEIPYPTKLLSTMWAQSEPYNLQTPLDGGTRSLTGCVATAMAQVMRYWQHPASGTGTSTAYYTTTKNIYVPSVNFSNTNYDYGNMLDIYPDESSGTVAQRNAVSTLMYHSGVSTYMDYKSSASGAALVVAVGALTNYFGYDNSIRYINANSSGISASDWKELVMGQIENNSPVLYGGQGASGGHAFVIDGYDGTERFHLNWGWHSLYDGFFVLTALNPGSSQYNSSQDMIINIMPNKNGNAPSQIKVSSFNTVKTSTAVTASINAKMNYGTDFSGKIGFAVVYDGVVSLVLDSASYSISNNYNNATGIYEVNYKAANLSKNISDANMPLGNLVLQVVTKRGNGEWTPVGETQTISTGNTYAISFNLNGGTGTKPATITGVLPNGKLGTEQKPSTTGFAKSGYASDGKWYTRTGSSPNYVYTEFVFGESGTAVTDNLILYLKWVPTYTVSFDLSDGTGTIPASIAGVLPSSKLGTEQKPSTAGFAKSGYVNDGKWYTRTLLSRSIAVEMRDYGSDGWNGAALRISVNGTNLPTTFTFDSGGKSSSSFNANPGDAVAFSWIRGSYNYECAFAAYYSDEPPSPSFNPNENASNDNAHILLYKQYYSLSDVLTGTNLGSFTVSAAGYGYEEFVFGEGGTAVTNNTTLYLKWTQSDEVSSSSGIASSSSNVSLSSSSSSDAISSSSSSDVSSPSSSSSDAISSSSSSDISSSSSSSSDAISSSSSYISSSSKVSSSSSATTTPIRLPQTASGIFRIRTTSNSIILENPPPNAKLEVYNLQGKRIYSATSH
ncbi:hypothetical protein R83H12_03114 [Fibrobacteria bacterium R8-3-H12]